MADTIAQSVGKGGVNAAADVKTVQRLLNRFVADLGLPKLAENGTAGQALTDAITAFQRKVMQITPDGRVDANGNTIKRLAKKVEGTTPPGGSVAVTYGKDVSAAARLVSPYGFKVIERAVGHAAMSAAVITSTIRFPAEQAAIMYRNAKTDLAAQFRLYGATGDEVLKVFRDHREQPQAEVIALMQTKIEELLARGRLVSRHVVTASAYANLNVIDIGVNSTRSVAGRSFNLAALTRAFQALKADGFIRDFIDETKKSNSCWHLEVVPNARPL